MERIVTDHQQRRVAVRITPGQYYNNRLLLGIAQYGRSLERWRFMGDPTGATQTADGLDGLKIDGLIVYTASKTVLSQFLSLGVPIVNTTGRPLYLPCARVRTDAESIGRAAAEHFIRMGIRRFFVIVRGGQPIDESRADAFDAHITATGLGDQTTARLVEQPKTGASKRNLASMRDAVRSHSRPIGIWCATDQIASAVISSLTQAGVSIPQQAAVLGCGNDELTCTFSDPRVSSVDTDAVTVGYRATELLDRLMSGQVQGTPSLTVPPVGVVERESTRAIAADDPQLAQAIRMVRQRACEGIRVSDVLEQVPLSRKSLERGFVQVVGLTPLQEIKRLQLEAAKEQLAKTEQTVDQIARGVGLRDGRYLSQVFRKAEGLTPTQYRQRQRSASADQ